MSLSRLDHLLGELRNMPDPDGPTWWVLRRFGELGEISGRATTDPPEWLQRVIVDCVAAVSRACPEAAIFGTIRMLERLGLVQIEHDESYVLAMVSCLGDRSEGGTRADALRRDPELQALVWRVFEIEGGGQVSLASMDKYSHPDATWAKTFHALVADGTLPRDRVLESCLQALGRDFSAYRAGWFAQMYRRLEPTTAEIVAQQPLLLRLLRSAVPATVSLAVGQLAVVAKANALDDDGYIAQCAAAMVVPAKATAIAAITLAANVASRRPDLLPAVAAAVGDGLTHSHRDVQSRALAVLRSLAATEVVTDHLDGLEPSVRRDAADWLGITIPRQVDATAVMAAAPLSPRASTTAETVAELGARLLAGNLSAGEVERFIAMLAVGETAGLEALQRQAARTLTEPRWEWTLRRSLAGLVVGAARQPAPAVAGPDTFLARRLGEIV